MTQDRITKSSTTDSPKTRTLAIFERVQSREGVKWEWGKENWRGVVRPISRRIWETVQEGNKTATITNRKSASHTPLEFCRCWTSRVRNDATFLAANAFQNASRSTESNADLISTSKVPSSRCSSAQLRPQAIRTSKVGAPSGDRLWVESLHVSWKFTLHKFCILQVTASYITQQICIHLLKIQ